MNPTHNKVNSLANSLTDNVYDSDDPFCRIFLPIDLTEYQWEVLIMGII